MTVVWFTCSRPPRDEFKMTLPCKNLHVKIDPSRSHAPNCGICRSQRGAATIYNCTLWRNIVKFLDKEKAISKRRQKVCIMQLKVASKSKPPQLRQRTTGLRINTTAVNWGGLCSLLQSCKSTRPI